MAKKSRYNPRNYRWFNKLIKYSFGEWIRVAYRVESRGDALFKTLPAPYVVVANHVSNRDPFLLSRFVPDPVYWVTSDGNMRTRFMRGVLGLVGSIPKTKAIPDIETVNLIVDVTRKRKGVVGVFAEGQASWDGRTLPLIPSTAKLLKLLKVPVVAARIKGGFAALPRWTWKRRRGKVVIEWEILLAPAELKALPAEEILRRLEKGLAHDEGAFLAAEPTAYESTRRAEHVELALFMCPRCGSIGSLKSSRSRLNCGACGEALSLGPDYRFRSLGGGEPVFPTIAAWDDWQRAAMDELARRAVEEGSKQPLFSDPVLLFRGRKMNALGKIRTGTLVLHPDRLEMVGRFGSRLSFAIESIEGAGVLKRNLFEFYVGRSLYQVRFQDRSLSARKWLMGVEALSRARAAASEGRGR